MARALAGYPSIAELAQAASHDGVLGPCDDDVEFAFGLDLILDGLERLRAARDLRTAALRGSSDRYRGHSRHHRNETAVGGHDRDDRVDTRPEGTGQYADVNGINLYYETHGSGRPLILLHGGLASGEMFGPVLPALARSSTR